MHPGIVILHDLRLHDFVWMNYVGRDRDQNAYLEAMDRWYGDDGLRAGQQFIAGGYLHRDIADDLAQRFPLTREVVNGALGVITHSEMALEKMGEVPDCPVKALKFPHAGIPDDAYFKIAAARYNRRPPHRILVFGYIQLNRRVVPLLEAFAGLPERALFRIDICGELWDKSVVVSAIERLNLNELVTLHDHLADHEVSRFFADADIAINLRNPTMGEASLSQMEFWEYGLPTLVTRTGWYSSLPEDSVCFVDPAREAEDIRRHLRHFLANPQAFYAKGESGRRTLSSHHPQAYSGELLQIAEQMSAAPQQIAGLKLAARTGLELRTWLQPGMFEHMMYRTSAEICEIFDRGVGSESSRILAPGTSGSFVQGESRASALQLPQGGPIVAGSHGSAASGGQENPVSAELSKKAGDSAPQATSTPAEGAPPLKLSGSQKMSLRVINGQGLIGDVPPGPPTMRAAVGKKIVALVRRCLFWLTPQIQAFQKEVALATREQVAALEDLAGRISALSNEGRLFREAISNTDTLVGLLQSEAEEMRGLIGRLASNQEALAQSFGQARTDLDRLGMEIAVLRSEIAAVRSATAGDLSRLSLEVGEFNSALTQLRASSEQQSRLLQAELLLRSARRTSPLEAPGLQELGDPVMSGPAYFEFQSRFRGSFEDIQQRLRVYLDRPAFQEAASTSAPFVDLGCGRGEWISLLRDRNISAYGVDSNSAMVEACAQAGLTAKQDDLLAHLRSLPDESRGGITAFHVAEHLPPAVLASMLEEFLRVLVPGGIVILETPNPTNVLVSTWTFHLDPTHQKPIPPELLHFLLESRGFTGIEIVPLHPYPREAMLNLPENLAAEFIDAHFFGPQDYAAICRKRPRSES
jgi:SAM-dependent methyltransferase/glycosyltransferase involved in cell wall biosynthesis